MYTYMYTCISTICTCKMLPGAIAVGECFSPHPAATGIAAVVCQPQPCGIWSAVQRMKGEGEEVRDKQEVN